ncbi:imidazoleglycerol-phosphate dehydratase HisB [Candidatus Aerophobetes bacterium]|nr:imidazoleglycerol-phosphate dehydratase HisB [Candidatus Aerophobetes bacterium]
MKERTGKYKRKTAETAVSVKINLDGSGICNVQTEIFFLNHMLSLLAKHGFFDIEVKASGDLEVDYHHTVEDIGICLGEAIKEALQDKKGIKRYGLSILPMDESLVRVALDLSGRGRLIFKVRFKDERVGSFEVNLIEEFFRALSYHSGMTLHINLIYGENSHHIIEAIFKSFAQTLDKASSREERLKGVPSSKGILD